MVRRGAGRCQQESEIPPDTAQVPFEGSIGIEGLDDGSFVLAWVGSSPLASYGEALVVELFDSRRRTFEEPIVIARTSYAFRNAVLKLNGDGRGVVVWQSQDLGNGPPDFGPFTGHFRMISVKP